MSNVDSQESFKNIVVQVIGEMSNKAAPHRKFVQTFVLAEQPNGYFVLNDIFRYISEDEEEEPENEEPTQIEASAQPAEEVEASTLPEPANSKQQIDIAQVDEGLEEEVPKETDVSEKDVSEKESSDPDVPNDEGSHETLEVVEAEDAPAAAVTATAEEQVEEPEAGTEAVAAVEEAQPEKPKEPDPTPEATPPQSAKATSAQAPPPIVPSKPAAPKTWANLLAPNRVAPPAVPAQAASASPAPSATKANPAAASRSVTPPFSPEDDTVGRPQQNGNSGWQTAGQESGKRQGRQQSVSGNNDKETVLGYVKNVTERVDASLLKSMLLQYGKLVYFDVSRQKVNRPQLLRCWITLITYLELCICRICRCCWV